MLTYLVAPVTGIAVGVILVPILIWLLSQEHRQPEHRRVVFRNALWLAIFLTLMLAAGSLGSLLMTIAYGEPAMPLIPMPTSSRAGPPLIDTTTAAPGERAVYALLPDDRMADTVAGEGVIPSGTNYHQGVSLGVIGVVLGCYFFMCGASANDYRYMAPRAMMMVAVTSITLGLGIIVASLVWMSLNIVAVAQGR